MEGIKRQMMCDFRSILLGFGLFLIHLDGSYAQTLNTIKVGDQVWMSENLAIKAHGTCTYNYDATYTPKYGLLYTWDAAKNACPSGFRLPNEKDWDELIEYLGGETQAGTELKVGGSSGFNAKLGGLSDSRGFSLLNYCGAYWSSASYSKTHAWYYLLNNKDGLVTKTYFSKSYGFSVRCIKDL